MSDEKGPVHAPQYGRLSERRDRFNRDSCYAKKRYTTEEHATKIRRKREANGSTPLRVYACFRCGGYHLTKLEAG